MAYTTLLRSNIGAELGRRGLYQKDVADALHLSKSTVAAKIQGKVDFKLSELIKIAEWLDIPFSNLTTGFDELTTSSYKESVS